MDSAMDHLLAAFHTANVPPMAGTRDELELRLRAVIAAHESTPPTDASGGVTDAMTQAACDKYHECGPFDSEYPSFVRMRAALEAADRARNPVDASAQADAPELTSADFPYLEHEKVIRAQASSAGEPVAWVDGADIGFLRDRGQRLTALSVTQDLPCMVPLYAAPTCDCGPKCMHAWSGHDSILGAVCIHCGAREKK